MTLAEYAQQIGITLHSAPNGRAFERMYRFRVALHVDGAPLWDGEYFMGSGHALPDGSAPTPTLADVLRSVCMDAQAFEDAPDLLEFCADFGYHIDTQNERKEVRQAHESCARASRALRKGLTDEQLDTITQLASEE